MTSAAAQPEFSMRLKAADAREGPQDTRFEADAGARARLAQRLGLVSLDRLEGRARWRIAQSEPGARGRPDVVVVHVAYAADVIQSCVVTLDPVAAHIEDAFERRYYLEAKGGGPGCGGRSTGERVRGPSGDRRTRLAGYDRGQDRDKRERRVSQARECELRFDEDEPPEPLTDGMFDIGEATAQELSLALDPYPRKEGVTLELPPDHGEDETSGERMRPLEVLRQWKGRDRE